MPRQICDSFVGQRQHGPFDMDPERTCVLCGVMRKNHAKPAGESPELLARFTFSQLSGEAIEHIQVLGQEFGSLAAHIADDVTDPRTRAMIHTKLEEAFLLTVRGLTL